VINEWTCTLVHRILLEFILFCFCCCFCFLCFVVTMRVFLYFVVVVCSFYFIRFMRIILGLSSFEVKYKEEKKKKKALTKRVPFIFGTECLALGFPKPRASLRKSQTADGDGCTQYG